MKQTIRQGAVIETVTPAELAAAMDRPRSSWRWIRATESTVLDANGNGSIDVYGVPMGQTFEARRVTVKYSDDPNNPGSTALGVLHWVGYLRSGSLVEFGLPMGANAGVTQPQVPGTQTWGKQQGPTLQNGEIFQAKLVGLTASIPIFVLVEGILRSGVIFETE